MPQWFPLYSKTLYNEIQHVHKSFHIYVSWPDMVYLFNVTWLSHLHSSLQYFNLTCVVSEEWLEHCCQDLDNDGNLKNSPFTHFHIPSNIWNVCSRVCLCSSDILSTACLNFDFWLVAPNTIKFKVFASPKQLKPCCAVLCGARQLATSGLALIPTIFASLQSFCAQSK